MDKTYWTYLSDYRVLNNSQCSTDSKLCIILESSMPEDISLGSKMPHFSVFGDTVNIAALMESTSEPMRVQMSHTTQVCY